MSHCRRPRRSRHAQRDHRSGTHQRSGQLRYTSFHYHLALHPLPLTNKCPHIADATNTTSLPIREKSALDNHAAIPDLSAKPTIPTSDAFNSATAANASTAAHPSAITSQESNASTTEGATLGHGSIGQGDAGVSDTKNLADTLSKTENSTSVADTVSGTDGPKTPGLAGFGDKPSISPNDESQLPKTVSGISSSGADSKAIGAGDADASATQNLSETLAKTEDTTKDSTSGKHIAPFAGETSANAQQAAAPAAAPIDIGTSNTSTATATTKPSTDKEADRTYKSTSGRSRGDSIRSLLSRADLVTGVVESTKQDTTTSGLATHTKSESPSGEKEKVSKMEKLKEKLHIGHKH